MLFVPAKVLRSHLCCKSFPFMPKIHRHSFSIGEIRLKHHYHLFCGWSRTQILANTFLRDLIWTFNASEHTTFSVWTRFFLEYTKYTSRHFFSSYSLYIMPSNTYFHKAHKDMNIVEYFCWKLIVFFFYKFVK